MSKLSDVLMAVRYRSEKSQEFLALDLGVSRKTIQAWESGKAEPKLSQVVEWFRACGVNPVPHLLEYAYPSLYGKLDLSDESKVNEAYMHLVQQLPLSDKLAVLYLFCGEHGSSPSSIIQLMLAHLHNPLRDRIPIASNVLTMYKMNVETGSVIGNGYPLPDTEALGNAIKLAVKSVISSQEGYTTADTTPEKSNQVNNEP